MALLLESEIILGVKIAKKRHFCLKVVMSVLGVGLVKFLGVLIMGINYIWLLPCVSYTCQEFVTF